MKKDFHHSHLHMINCLKYTVYVISYTFNFLIDYISEIVIVWICVAIFTMFYAYIWDVTYDWGFFQKHSKNKYLRNDLAYPSKMFYYFALVMNLIFRMGWMLILAPNVVDTYLLKNVV